MRHAFPMSAIFSLLYGAAISIGGNIMPAAILVVALLSILAITIDFVGAQNA